MSATAITTPLNHRVIHLLSLFLIELIAAGCDRTYHAPLQIALNQLSSCARVEIQIEPTAKGEKLEYSIKDQKEIETIAKWIDPKLKTFVQTGRYGTATYVGIKAFAQESDTRPIVTFTIIDETKLVFELNETLYETQLPDNTLCQCLRKHDFVDLPTKNTILSEGR